MRERRGEISFVASRKEWRGEVKETDSKIKHVKRRKRGETLKEERQMCLDYKGRDACAFFPGR